MSLSSATNRVRYTGNGAANVYAYTFRVFANTDLKVIVADTASPPVETTLALTTDYTVSGVGDASGGNITLVNSGQSWLTSGNLKSNYKLTIRRVRPLTQETDIRNQGSFLPETHEDEFDRGVMVAQQQQDEIDRSIKLPETVATSDFDPTLPTDIDTAERYLLTNSDGDGFTLSATAGADVLRVFNSTTYEALKALALAAPTQQRWGWATNIKQLVFYTADTTVGDEGWIVVGG